MKTILLGAVFAAAADVPTKNIVELAKSVEDLSILVTAVVAGDLVETLSSPGPFTVFAPTNEAWKQLGTSADAPPKKAEQRGTLSPTVDVLLKPENKDQLVEILKFHVLPYQCRTVEPGTELQNCQGGINVYRINADGQGVSGITTQMTMNSHRGFATYGCGKEGCGAGGSSVSSMLSGIYGSWTCQFRSVQLNQTGPPESHECPLVTGPDNLATNGVVHIIDRVLLPQLVNHCDYQKGGGIFHPETDSCEECGGGAPDSAQGVGNFSNVDETACVYNEPVVV